MGSEWQPSSVSNWDPSPDEAHPARDQAARRGEIVIGNAVRMARLRVGRSQGQLGELVDLAQPTISRLETGSLRGLRFRRLAMIMGVIQVVPRFTLPEDSPPRSDPWRDDR